MAVFTTNEAEKISQTIDHAVELVNKHSTTYCVVYIDKFKTTIPMRAEPCPSEFGWQVIMSITPD